MNTTASSDPRRLLYSAFAEKKGRNPSFSLRAFSRQLGISPAQLSQLISGKRLFTPSVALKVASALELSPMERDELLARVHGRGGAEPGAGAVTVLSEDQFKLISEWYHFAILSLGGIPGNRFDARWVARRLGIDPLTAREAMERLERLGWIEKKGAGFAQASAPLRAGGGAPSEAVRKYHKQNLELAARKIDDVELSLRAFTSVTVATDLKRLRKAKELIERFKEELSKVLAGPARSEVYTLAIQLFPVTEFSNKKER